MESTNEPGDITEVIQAYMPLRRKEQKVGITHGPYDPGGQPVLETDNRFYLGFFAWNVAGGTSITKAVLLDQDNYRDYWTWPRASHLIKEAERGGLEFELPIGGWLGSGGATHVAEGCGS